MAIFDDQIAQNSDERVLQRQSASTPRGARRRGIPMLIKIGTLVLSGLTLAAALASPAAAAPITYAELNGSLDYPNTHAIGTFDVGVNTVSGSVNGSGGQAPNYDSEDKFSFILPSGYEIVSATVTITNFSFGVGPVHLTGTYSLAFAGLTLESFPIVQNTTTSNLLVTPATAAGEYDVTHVEPSSASTPNGMGQTFYSGSYGYSDSFTVALIPNSGTTVPEPGSIVLLLSAEFGLTLLSGRSRSNTIG